MIVLSLNCSYFINILFRNYIYYKLRYMKSYRGFDLIFFVLRILFESLILVNFYCHFLLWYIWMRSSSQFEISHCSSVRLLMYSNAGNRRKKKEIEWASLHKYIFNFNLTKFIKYMKGKETFKVNLRVVECFLYVLYYNTFSLLMDNVPWDVPYFTL